jgi:hypothetical protein
MLVDIEGRAQGHPVAQGDQKPAAPLAPSALGLFNDQTWQLHDACALQICHCLDLEGKSAPSRLFIRGRSYRMRGQLPVANSRSLCVWDLFLSTPSNTSGTACGANKSKSKSYSARTAGAQCRVTDIDPDSPPVAARSRTG